MWVCDGPRETFKKKNYGCNAGDVIAAVCGGRSGSCGFFKRSSLSRFEGAVARNVLKIFNGNVSIGGDYRENTNDDPLFSLYSTVL